MQSIGLNGQLAEELAADKALSQPARNNPVYDGDCFHFSSILARSK